MPAPHLLAGDRDSRGKWDSTNSLQEFVGYGAYTESGIVLARRLILREGSRIESSATEDLS